MIGIISDIHGNLPALKSVLKELEKLNVCEIICLGDVAGYYTQVNECIDVVRQSCSLCLLGNHDWYLAFDKDCPRSQSANTCLKYQRSIVSENNREWLQQLCPKKKYLDLNIAHAGWNDPLDEYLTRPNEHYFGKLPGKYFSSGHTHIPMIWKSKTKIYCNPGSVGQPRDGNRKASFAIWKNNTFEIHRVEYDYIETQAQMKSKKFDKYFYQNLEFGLKIGDKRLSNISN